MISFIWLVEITCPECGTKQIGIEGSDMENSFHCLAKVEITKTVNGKVITVKSDECNYYTEKTRHIDEKLVREIGSWDIAALQQLTEKP